jgi:hypothetical protein
MTAVEGFSDVPGFRLCDFATECKAGGPCPAQEKLVSQFVGDATEESVESGISFEDKTKLSMALTGFRLAARFEGCEGATEGKCAALVEMNQNSVKRTAVRGLKKVIFSRGN